MWAVVSIISEPNFWYNAFFGIEFILSLFPSIEQMKIGGITVRVPPLLFAVTVFFAATCAIMYGSSKDLTYLYFGAPLCIILLCVPLAMTYLTEKQMINRLPTLRARAKFLRARQISPAMVGTPVILEGKILKVMGLSMGKPAYLLSDPTGQIIVRRFALPEPLVGVGADVEVVGTVVRKLTNADSVYVNAVSIHPVRKLRNDTETSPGTQEEKIHIKKFP